MTSAERLNPPETLLERRLILEDLEERYFL